MIASQLIYTGCGKDKTGAFSVWSKSADITKAEETEIQRTMIYKRPSSLPFEPTQEELDTLFPRKFGFFNLSSGRVCLAQSSYIGNVYSDLDKRTGNYIIHAFVFDSINDMIPMNYINSEIFKRCLTYEEWHENAAPDELPQIDFIEKASPITKQEVDEFFDENRLNNLKLLVQATINASTIETKVTFYDKHENLKYWYKALGLCLPKRVISKITFCTFYTPSTPSPTQGTGGTPMFNTDIKIRNIAPTISSSLFSYSQEVGRGNYAFDFESGIIPANITVSNYADNIVCGMKQNLFNVFKVVDAIDNIAFKCECDIDIALHMFYFINKHIDKVDNIDLICKLLSMAKLYYNDLLSDIADSMYEYGFENNRWMVDERTKKIYRFVFDYSEKANKAELIGKYIDNLEGFGISVAQSPDSYYETVVSNAPFDWVNFVDYVFEQNLLCKVSQSSNASFNSEYLLFRTLTEYLNDIVAVEDQKRTVLKYFVETARNHLNDDTADCILTLIVCIKKCGEKWAGWLIKNAIAVLCGQKPISEVLDAERVLVLAEQIGECDMSNHLVYNLVVENLNQQEFVKLFIKRSQSNSQFYNRIIAGLKGQEKFEIFLEMIEIYKICVADYVTRADLNKFYNQYCANSRYFDIFSKLLEKYLRTCPTNSIIDECLACYNEWFNKSATETTFSQNCVVAIASKLFTVSVEGLQDFIRKNGTTYTKPLVEAAKSLGCRVPYQYYVVAFGEYLRRNNSTIRNSKSVLRKEILESIEQETFFKIPNNAEAYAILVDLYLVDILHLFLQLADENSFDIMLTGFFKPLYSVSGFENKLIDILWSMKNEEFQITIMYLSAYACGKQNCMADTFKHIIDDVLKELGRGKRKKLFKFIADNVPIAYAKKTVAFSEQYQKEHESFLDKLFGSFGREDKEDDKKGNKKDTSENTKKKWKK